MKKLLSLCLLALALAVYADDNTIRDANGRIIGTVSKNPGGSETVRDQSGKIVEQKSPSTGTVIVRDATGKIIRTEPKR